MIEIWALAFVLILVRSATFVMFLPAIGGQNSPNTVKVGLATALAVMWFLTWGVIPSAELLGMSSRHWLGYAVAMLREGLLGAALGFTFGLFLLPARIAGAYVSQEMGLTLAAITDPETRTPTSVVTRLFEALAILMFFALDVHHVLFMAAHASFVVWPIGAELPDLSTLMLVEGFNDAHRWGLMLAAPLGICLFLALIVLALLNRASPQLNLFSVGLVIRLGVGLGAGILFLPGIVGLFFRFFQNAISSVQTMFAL